MSYTLQFGQIWPYLPSLLAGAWLSLQIAFVAFCGGLLIGTMMHGLPMADATKTYTLLTIGDGLVAQIPGLMLSVAVAIIVTRVTREQDMGGELQKQLFGQPKALGVAAAVLGIMDMASK